MSVGNSASGGHSRSKIALLTAVLVVAMFMAVPVAVAYDSDAYTDGETGYTVTFTDKADDSELTQLGTTKSSVVNSAAGSVMGVFNFEFYTFKSTVDNIGTFEYTTADGAMVKGKTRTVLSATDLEVKGLKVTYTATSQTDMFDIDDSNTAKEKAMAEAMAAYFGTDKLSPGDTLVLEVSGRIEGALWFENNYADMNETQCLLEKRTSKISEVNKTEATLTFTPNGGIAKSITMKCDTMIGGSGTSTYDYGKPLSEVKAGDKVTVKEDVDSMNNDLSIKATIGDKDYYIDDLKPEGDDEDTYQQTVSIVLQSDIAIPDYMVEEIASFADTDNVKFDKSYSAAKSEFDSVYDDGFPAKKSKLPLIIGGVVAAVVIIGIVAFFIIRKKA